LVLLDDAWFSLPPLGGQEGETAERLLVFLQLELVILNLLEQRKDVRLVLF
jgi:hypothetical protein